MENLNAETVKKALECCARGRKSKDDRPCLDCAYNECNLVGGTSERQTTGTCQGWLMKDALALINSQEQRIKELTEENKKLKVEIDFSKELRKEIEAEFLLMHCKYGSALQTIRAKTVLKMYSMLREGRVSNDTVVIVANQVAKEMLEGDK